jgi:diguanylate cyclase (GGDEF)-like protein/PAS domain S-box-containing protein
MKVTYGQPYLSIRMIFVISFIVLLIATVSVVAYLVFTNWLASTDDMITRMENDVDSDIVHIIEDFINIPLHVNEENHGLIQNKIVDLTDRLKREKFFTGVLQANSKCIYSFSYGTANGEYYGARRNPQHEIEIISNDAGTKGHSWYFATTPTRTAGKLALDAGKFDPRTRDWYQIAKVRRRPVFSPIYQHFVMNDLALSAAYPIYDQAGRLKGVLGTHIILSKINRFLKKIVKAKNALAYIVEAHSGALIANSLEMSNFKTLADGTVTRATLAATDNRAIIQAYQDYQKGFRHNYLINTKNDKFHINFTQYQKHGLEWLLITVIPENQYTVGIYRSIRITLCAMIIILILTVGFYLQFTKMVLNPVYHLIKVTDQFAQGNLLQRAKRFRNDEIGKLAHAFNAMADSLYECINNLEEKVQERTGELEKANLTLKENQQNLQLLLDSAYEAVYGVDSQGNCTFCNNSCLKLLGYRSQEELIGKNMHALIHYNCKHGAVLGQQECRILTTLRTGEGAHADDEVFWRSDHTCFDVEYFSYPQYKEGVLVGAVVTFMDITERKKAAKEIAYLSFHDPLTGLYNRRFFEEELKRLDAPRNLPFSVISADVNGLKLVNDIFGHTTGDLLIQKAAATMQKSCRSDEIIARIGGDEFIILLPKTDREAVTQIAARIKRQFFQERIKFLNGSISVGYSTKNFETENILREIEKADEQMYAQKALDRKDFKSATIKAIMQTLHENYPREAGHSQNVSQLCQDLGKTLHLSESEINRLKDVGFLHDIGKIVIEAAVIDKVPPLTDQEWQALRQHPVVGYRILNSCEMTVGLAKYVLSHHERWDGSGYPNGLTGEAIPKLARILAVAESYERIVGGAAYQKARSRKEALLEIQKNAGSQFDPKIVAAFLEMMQII